MTNLAHPIESEIPNKYNLLPLDSNLPISSDQPVKIYMQISGSAAQFAVSSTGPWYPGISWQYSSADYGLFITFHMPAQTTLQNPSAGLWFSPLMTGKTHQKCCVPSTSGTYTFNVNNSTTPGNIIDPQIVVTPL